jgi:hypothetical protein
MVATRRLAAAAAVLPLLLWPDQTMWVQMLLVLQALKPRCFGWVATHALLLRRRSCKHIWLICMLLLGWSLLLLLLLLLKLSLRSHTQHRQCIRSSDCVITNASRSC